MVVVARVSPDAFRWDAQSGPAEMLNRVRSACADVDHHDPLDEATQLWLKHRGLEESALWLVGDSGFALRHDGDTVALDVAVVPSTRRCGFGGGLVEAAMQGVDGPVEAWSHGDHPAAAVLARRFGFQRARELWLLRSRTPAVEPVEAPGIEIRTFRPGDEPDLLRVNAAAFAHHPEQGGMDAGNLAARMAEPWFDPGGLFLAYDAKRLVGFHWTKVHPSGSGEVYVVGISPDSQGRGLGKALTAAGLRHLAARGVPDVHLYVEATNAAGIALYTGLGFNHAETHVQYRKD